MEAVETDIQEMNSGRKAEPVLSIQGKPRYFCGKEGHLPRVCRFHDAVCRSCGKKGHMQVVCCSKSNNQRRMAPVKNLKDAENSDEEVNSTDGILGVFKVYTRANTVKSAPPSIIPKMRLSGKVLPMEVDTGAVVSIVSQHTYRKHIGSVRLLPAALQLHTYTDKRLVVEGKCKVTVEYKGQQAQADIFVVAGQGPSLLGRNILQHIKLDWVSICKVHCPAQKALSSLLNSYGAMFSDQLGTFVNHKAKLHLSPCPTFEPLSFPFALKTEVEKELDKLVSSGVLEPVPAHDWASPIIVVPKKDGIIRLCGDYKVTINPLLVLDSHPLPNPQELFASLAGG